MSSFTQTHLRLQFAMSKENHVYQSHMRDTEPVPEVIGGRPIVSGETSSPGLHDKTRQLLGKVKNGAIERISRLRFSRSREPIPVINDREGASSTPKIEVQDPALSGVEHHAEPKPALPRSHDSNTELVEPAANNVQAVIDPQHLRAISTLFGEIAEVVHSNGPALRVLSSAATMTLAQTDCDQDVYPLLVKLAEFYDFISQNEILGQISSMYSTVGQIARQTLDCALFMRDYSEKKFRKSGKNDASETDLAITRYITSLDALMQNIQHQVPTIFVQRTGEILDLSGMPHAAGAGLDTTKQCLPGTRTKILSEITEFINRSGDAVPCVLWLSGPAGTGKSAIAHTIANWFNDVGVPVSCFCFDRQKQADRRHEKFFSTIARDLADCDPEMKRALADAVMASAVKNTGDIIQQWQQFIVQPLGRLSELNATPFVIVIDALDESGDVKTRRDLLRILAGKLRHPGIHQITALPNNVRFIVTSRPLRDIDAEFSGVQHIRRMSMDDIPITVAERDIRLYVSQELEGLSFGVREFAVLAEKADGLFKWAHVACCSIKEIHSSPSQQKFFNDVVYGDPAMREDLLSDMYLSILNEIMSVPKDAHMHRASQTMLDRFRSVIGQILGTAEPLPLHSLNAMRRHFPDSADRYEAEVVVNSMGSLLSGTINSRTPIRLHASFRDFLTNKTCSGVFFVDVAKAHRNLAFASLRVMEDELRFNVCDLKSSYIPNCEDSGLRERVEKRISPHLSYSCRFWIPHIRATGFDKEIAKHIKSFFDSERLLFWLEALGLLKAISRAADALPLITQWWLKTHSEYEDVSFAATDAQKFIQTFGGIILYSTPHLYISALPFSPSNSAISRKFLTKFPRTLHLTSGHDENWPVVQSRLHGHMAGVLAVSSVLNGTRIVTASADMTIRLWNGMTGELVCEPLRGHTGAVNTVSFSLDETHIVSGSSDHTVRLWEAATGKPVGEPLQEHTGAVNSVSFSPDGSHIGSGSSDLTIWLWDVKTKKPISQLCGHTARVNSVSFSRESNLIVSGSDDKTIRLWKAGTRIGDVQAADETIWLWDAMVGQLVGEPLLGHTGAVTSVSFSWDGSRIASGSFDKTVRLWNVASQKPVGEPLQGHTAWVNSVSFSLDTIHIVSGSSDNTIRLWEAATGKSVSQPLRGHIDSVNSVSFSSNGTRIVSGSVDNTIRLWHATIGQPEEDSTSVDKSRTINTTNDGTLSNTSDNTILTNTWNNQFICFSSNLDHALRNSAELIEGTSHDHSMSASFSLGADGWMEGPNQYLLFWVPLPSRRAFYTPQTAMVIPGRPTELDLRDMVHGQQWYNCRLGDNCDQPSSTILDDKA